MLICLFKFRSFSPPYKINKCNIHIFSPPMVGDLLWSCLKNISSSVNCVIANQLYINRRVYFWIVNSNFIFWVNDNFNVPQIFFLTIWIHYKVSINKFILGAKIIDWLKGKRDILTYKLIVWHECMYKFILVKIHV